MIFCCRRQTSCSIEMSQEVSLSHSQTLRVPLKITNNESSINQLEAKVTKWTLKEMPPPPKNQQENHFYDILKKFVEDETKHELEFPESLKKTRKSYSS